ncbi:MAG: KpsF/GutQ family sugar-phosphate isomerase [Chloracidobacterium sp.]|uniref:KpsF/GutQ family sugar-phosphate isomerase n=1 Tax=Chloracidobacterium validum TaxID=2821543 RepID=A0ABX8B5A5_9BACT|nr:KpsF/GutQ family sugar-phosphate isomerase [Chloracidobacterium validum]QUW02152.1 KpsF/GutQ family sugar-phosphate isomerase [Chloracidobacterium validum]
MTHIERGRQTLRVEAEAVARLAERLDDNFERAVEVIAAGRGHVATLGMGKSGFVARKTSATLASLGTPSFFLHPAEAAHGDIGRVTSDDVLLVFSHSGETEEIVRLLPSFQRMRLPLIAILGRPDSTLGRAAQIILDTAVDTEACPLNLAPTASTTAALALGDALAVAVGAARGFAAEDFAARHPGGKLGRELLRVADVMHTGADVPRVLPTTQMPDIIHEISRKGFGVTTVVDAEHRLLGVISDGDLRRLMEHQPETFLRLTAGAALEGRHSRHPHPRTARAADRASAALRAMEAYRITSLVVVDARQRVEGLVHLHDLWSVLSPSGVEPSV